MKAVLHILVRFWIAASVLASTFIVCSIAVGLWYYSRVTHDIPGAGFLVCIPMAGSVVLSWAILRIYENTTQGK